MLEEKLTNHRVAFMSALSKTNIVSPFWGLDLSRERKHTQAWAQVFDTKSLSTKWSVVLRTTNKGVDSPPRLHIRPIRMMWFEHKASKIIG